LQVQSLANNVNLIIEKGNVYFAQGEYDLVNYQAFLALYIDPSTEVAHQLRIQTAFADDNPGQAVLYAQEYLHYFPGSTLAYKYLGDARLAEGNPDEAIIAYSRGLTGDSNPFTLDTLLARAALYMQQERYDLARADYTDAFALSENPEILALRMNAAYNEGRYQIALDDAEQLTLDDSGAVPQGEIDLIRAFALVDQSDEEDTAALQQAVNLLVGLPGREGITPETLPVVYEYTARGYLMLGNEAAALQAINTALDLGESGRRRFIRAQILDAQGDRNGAVRDYEWVLTWSQVFPFPFRGEAEEALERLTGDTA
jgi:tetratricopeptide (TPR) repeat protein